MPPAGGQGQSPRWEVWHPSLQGCFSGVPLIPVPIYVVKMSSKPSKWLFDTIGTNEIREKFLLLDLF